MPPKTLSSVIKQAEEVLDEVLRSLREECANPDSVLCETDRNRFVEEEESLREPLREAAESESKGWRNLLCLSSPQAVKCLEGAEALRRRVKEDIHAKVRTRITGISNPPASPNRKQGSAFGSMGARTPETDTGLPFADSNPQPTRAMITSPLNMCCPVSEPSELVVYPAVQNDCDYTSDLNEAINTPLETSSDRSRNSSGRRRRRSPPPPPRPRQMLQSSTSDLSSEATTGPGSDSPRRSQSIRRPAPPPPQSTRRSGTPRSPTNGLLPSPAFSPNIAMMSSISELTQHMDKIVSSVLKESLSEQGQGGRPGRGLKAKTNCMNITNSNVDGPTLINGGSKNSGAVIHKTVSPARLPQHV
ncbi:hypothetical protein J3R83DRAFT_3829 [Lanmaoa asiatica]|nr:hypothetical protein J3R83DRAFT_3829 [Lanmaoa asiatica]